MITPIGCSNYKLWGPLSSITMALEFIVFVRTPKYFQASYVLCSPSQLLRGRVGIFVPLAEGGIQNQDEEATQSKLPCAMNGYDPKLGSKCSFSDLWHFLLCIYSLALELPTRSDLAFIKLRSALIAKDNWGVPCYKNSLCVAFFHPYLSIR